MTPPTVQFIPAAGGEDWDTYADGIWFTEGFQATDPSSATSQTQKASSVTFTMPSQGFYNATVRSRYHSDTSDSTAPPYVAIWDVSASAWYVKQYQRYFGSSGAYVWQFGLDAYGGTFSPVNGNDYYFVFLTQDPGSITGWNDYDGPA